MRQLPLGVRLRADAVFASFAAGHNVELLSALRSPGTVPLWVWGAPGCGKTHLLQAICAAVDAAAGEVAAYLPMSPGSGLPAAALAGFESCHVVCVDDVDSVAGDLAFEDALFALFNAAAECGTRLVFAAAAAPRSLPWRLEDWRSRAAACVVYQLHDLDEAGRAEALTLRAAQRGLLLPAETAQYLLRRMPRDLTSLYGVLDQLDEASLVAQRRLTIPFIRAALEKFAGITP